MALFKMSQLGGRKSTRQIKQSNEPSADLRHALASERKPAVGVDSFDPSLS
jgi:hypothetical protein